MTPRPRDRVALVYLAAGVTWIAITSWGVVPALQERYGLSGSAMELAKGLAFVGVTALVLWVALGRFYGRLEQAAEHEHRIADRLRRADAVKNQLLVAVSHELRTPLTAVQGLSATLEVHQDELSPERQRHLLSRLNANAVRLERLLEDLLDVDRLARGVIDARRRSTHLRPLVMAVLEEMNVRGLDVHVDVADDLVLALDGPKVARIVENLVRNAAVHTPGGTRIWIDAELEGTAVLLSVADDGPGVPLAQRSRIFQPFTQGPGRVGHPSPGTGIGLALVAQFAVLHGGGAWVEERPGGGSRFCVRLADVANHESTMRPVVRS